jgi:hypothetical protein
MKDSSGQGFKSTNKTTDDSDFKIRVPELSDKLKELEAVAKTGYARMEDACKDKRDASVAILAKITGSAALRAAELSPDTN